MGCELQVPMCFLGFRNQTELPEVYAMTDVMVLPSGAETWGLVVNEARDPNYADDRVPNEQRRGKQDEHSDPDDQGRAGPPPDGRRGLQSKA